MVEEGGDLPLVDGYETICRIASGDMANAWLARRLCGDQTPVVLKTILPYLARDRDFARLFEQEARLAASLNQDNIVRVFDHGNSHGTWYIATEFVSGCTMRQIQQVLRARRKAPPRWLVLGVMASVCEALRAAHEHCDPEGKPARIIHGDLTPENIMLSVDGVVKVVDFGIARAATGSYVNSRVTRGKIAYLAPEIADVWSGSTLDARCDVYSVGVIMYEALTGARPYPKGGDLEMLRLITPDGPMSVRRVAGWIPERLSRIVMRAISRDPEKRFQSAADLGMAIEGFLGSMGTRPTEEQLADYMRKLVGPSEPPDSSRSALSAVLRNNALEESIAKLRASAVDLPPDSMASAPPSSAWADVPSRRRSAPPPCFDQQDVAVEVTDVASVEIGDEDIDWAAVFEEDTTTPGKLSAAQKPHPSDSFEPVDPAPMTQRVWDLSGSPRAGEASAKAIIKEPVQTASRPEGEVVSAATIEAAQSKSRPPKKKRRLSNTAEVPRFTETADLPRIVDEPRPPSGLLQVQEPAPAAGEPGQESAPITSQSPLDSIAAGQDLAPITSQSQQAAVADEKEQAPAPALMQPEEALGEVAPGESKTQESADPPEQDKARSVWDSGSSAFGIGRKVDKLWKRSASRRIGEAGAERGSGVVWDEIAARGREATSHTEIAATDASFDPEPAPPAPCQPEPADDAASKHSWDRVTLKRKTEQVIEANGSSTVQPAPGEERDERDEGAAVVRRDPWDPKTIGKKTPQVEAMELFDEGLRLVREGSIDEARRLWERGRELDPENRRLKINLRRLEARLEAENPGQRRR